MSRSVSAFVLVVAGVFVLLALTAALGANWRAAVACLALGAAVLFFGSVGWFFMRFPQPNSEAEKRWNPLSSDLLAYRKRYPGWQSRLVVGVLAAMLLLVLLLRLYGLLHG